jgi:DNA adenine methylase
MSKPFLKWAGGKRQLLKSLSPLFPKALLQGKVKRYAEPFLGGGALFFHLAEKGYQFERSLLCDANPELILVYRVVQKKVEDLITLLESLEKDYFRLTLAARKTFFLKVRTEFNESRKGFAFQKLDAEAIRRAARFIFLNRTGFNGLWRVNQSAEFNVPFGRYKQPRICDVVTLKSCQKTLNSMKAEILNGDFEEVKAFATAKTFVYYDPPYRPVSSSSNFNTYTAQGFGDAEQTRLANLFGTMHEKSCLQMLSNSESTDHFFQKLYHHSDWKIIPVKARRAINSQASSRGQVNEIVVVNYPVMS